MLVRVEAELSASIAPRKELAILDKAISPVLEGVMVPGTELVNYSIYLILIN